MALYFLLSVEAGSFDQSGARRIEARAIFVFKLISSRRPLTRSVSRASVWAAVYLTWIFLVIKTKIRTIMSSNEKNSEVAVDKVGDEKSGDAKSDLKGAKRAAEVSAHVRLCIHFRRSPFY